MYKFSLYLPLVRLSLIPNSLIPCHHIIKSIKEFSLAIREFSLAYSQLDYFPLALLSLALLPRVSPQHFLSHARSPTFSISKSLIFHPPISRLSPIRLSPVYLLSGHSKLANSNLPKPNLPNPNLPKPNLPNTNLPNLTRLSPPCYLTSSYFQLA